MNERFLDALEGRLNAEEHRAFEQALGRDEALARTWAEYRAIKSLEEFVAEVDPMLDEDLSEQIFASIDGVGEPSDPMSIDVQRPVSHAVSDSLPLHYRWWIAGLGSVNAILATLLLCLVVGRGSVNTPQTVTAVSIPSQYAAYRAVPINVALSEEQVSSDAMRLDLRVRYQQGAEQRTAELARFLPVVDVWHAADRSESTLVVLVPDELVERLNRARVLGELEVVLTAPLEDRVDGTVRRVQGTERQPVYDPVGRLIAEDLPAQSLSVLYLKDRPGGTTTRHVFFRGDWLPDSGLNVVGF